MWSNVIRAILITVFVSSSAFGMSTEEQATVAAVETVSKSVVLIAASGVQVGENSIDVQQFQTTGSGFAVAPGFVVTNFHVVEHASQIEVVLADYRSARASVVGTAPAYDLALLQVPFTANDMAPIDPGAPTTLQVGQSAIAISNPLGLQNSVSRGIISGLGREFPDFEIGPRLIQFDAPINPGQSGGPLVDSAGRVIGMTTFKLLDAESIGFAIPFDLIRETLPDLVSMGHPFRPQLGFRGTNINPDLASLFELPTEWGVLVEEVDEGSVAEKIGLRRGHRLVTMHGRVYVLGGDIIVSIDGRQVRGTSDLVDLFMGARPGQRITLRVMRNGGYSSIQLEIPTMEH